MNGLLSSTFRSREGTMRWWAALILALAVLPLATGCYGQFPAVRAVYKINGDCHENGAVQSVVMWIFVIVPVYGVATVADVFILNLLEFWSGETIEIGTRAEQDGITYALEPSQDGRRARMTVSRDGKILGQAFFVKTSDGEFEVRDADGRLAGKVVRTADGGLELTDASGAAIRTISAEQLASVPR